MMRYLILVFSLILCLYQTYAESHSHDGTLTNGEHVADFVAKTIHENDVSTQTSLDGIPDTISYWDFILPM